MNFEELTRQVGFPLAVVIYSQQVPIGVSFWNILTFDQWNEVWHKLPTKDHIRLKDVLYRMKLKAETFSHIMILYHLTDSPMEQAELVAQGSEKAVTFKDWYWVYAASSDPAIKEAAFAKMKAVPSTFNDWTDTNVATNHHDDLGDILCDLASTQSDWLQIYRRWFYSNGSPVYVKSCQRLEELVPTFAGWQNIYRANGRSSSRDLIGEFALEMMTRYASSLKECLYVYDRTPLAHKNRAVVVGKIERTEGSFADWQWLFVNTPLMSNFQTIAMQKMAERATTMKEWLCVYENSLLQPEQHRKALEEMTRLATAEPSTV